MRFDRFWTLLAVALVHRARFLEVRVAGELLPAALIAKRLDVSRQLVYWWITQGKLKVAEITPAGRKLYDLHTAAAVDRDTRRSPYSHRVYTASEVA